MENEIPQRSKLLRVGSGLSDILECGTQMGRLKQGEKDRDINQQEQRRSKAKGKDYELLNRASKASAVSAKNNSWGRRRPCRKTAGELRGDG